MDARKIFVFQWTLISGVAAALMACGNDGSVLSRDSEPDSQALGDEGEEDGDSDNAPGLESDRDTSPENDSDPGPESDSDPGLESDSDPGPESDSDPGLESDSDPGPESDSDPGPESDSDPGPESDSDPGPESDSDPGPDSDSESAPGADTGSAGDGCQDPCVREDGFPIPGCLVPCGGVDGRLCPGTRLYCIHFAPLVIDLGVCVPDEAAACASPEDCACLSGFIDIPDHDDVAWRCEQGFCRPAPPAQIGVQCGDTLCLETEVCCQSETLSFHCTEEACPGNLATCDGPEDCLGDCCLSIGAFDRFMCSEETCVDAACHTDGDCPASQQCEPYNEIISICR